MALEVKDYELFELAYNSNVANPEKCVYVNDQGVEFSVLSEGCQTDESWMEYIDEYRSIINPPKTSLPKLAKAKVTDNDTMFAEDIDVKPDDSKHWTEKVIMPKTKKSLTFSSDNKGRNGEYYKKLHMKSRRKTGKHLDTEMDVSRYQAHKLSTSTSQSSSIDSSEQSNPTSDDSSTDSHTVVPNVKPSVSASPSIATIRCTSAIKSSTAPYRPSSIINTAAMVQARLCGVEPNGHMDTVALSNLAGTSIRQSLSPGQLRTLINDYCGTVYKYANIKNLPANCRVKRNSVAKAQVMASERFAQQRASQKNNDVEFTMHIPKAQRIMQKMRKEAADAQNKKPEADETKRDRKSVRLQSPTANGKNSDDSTSRPPSAKEIAKELDDAVRDRVRQERRMSQNLEAAERAARKNADILSFSLQHVKCKDWINIPEDLELKIKEAKMQREKSEISRSQAKLLFDEENDLSTIPLNIMMAAMANKLEKLVKDTQEKAKRTVRRQNAVVAQKILINDCHTQTIKYHQKRIYGEHGCGKPHLREAGLILASKSNQGNLLSVVKLKRGRGRKGVLRTDIKLDVTVKSEYYKRPNQASILSINSVTVDQFNRSKFFTHFFYKKTTRELEIPDSPARPALQAYYHPASKYENWSSTIIFQIFDEHTGNILLNGNTANNIYIKDLAYFDCRTHCLQMFKTGRARGFIQDKFVLRISKHFAMQYDKKGNSLTISFEDKSTGNVARTLRIPLQNPVNDSDVRKNTSINQNVVGLYLTQQKEKVRQLLDTMRGIVFGGKPCRFGQIKVDKSEEEISLAQRLQDAVIKKDTWDECYYVPMVQISHAQLHTQSNSVSFEEGLMETARRSNRTARRPSAVIIPDVATARRLSTVAISRPSNMRKQPSASDLMALSRDSRPISRDGRPISRDSRPIGRDSRPISRDSKPIARDSKPTTQRDNRPVTRDSRQRPGTRESKSVTKETSKREARTKYQSAKLRDFTVLSVPR